VKTGAWCVSANWGIYKHIVLSDLKSYKEAVRFAGLYKDHYLRTNRRKPGRKAPEVNIWQLHHQI
jgi:hypothetical protein